MVKASKDDTNCPSCGAPDWLDVCESCAYSELRCPFCDVIVSSMGTEDDAWQTAPCDCVVAWANYGDETTWEDEKFRAKAFKRAQSARRAAGKDLYDGPEEFSPSLSGFKKLFKGDPNVDVQAHDDGAGHGHSTGTWFVFAKRPKRSKPGTR